MNRLLQCEAISLQGPVMTKQSLPPGVVNISGKNLGNAAAKNFCPACFWLKLRVKDFPHSPFPGVFSTIDKGTKNYVQAYFEKYNKMPPWLEKHGDYVEILPPTHYSKFSMINEQYKIQTRGNTDDIFRERDGSLTIVDYKTAVYSEHQDELRPIYEIQLNTYAMIAEHLKLGHVKKLLLIYFEPKADFDDMNKKGIRVPGGMRMLFKATPVNVPINPASVESAMALSRLFINMQEMPEGREHCKECKKLKDLMSVLPDASQQRRIDREKKLDDLGYDNPEAETKEKNLRENSSKFWTSVEKI